MGTHKETLGINLKGGSRPSPTIRQALVSLVKGRKQGKALQGGFRLPYKICTLCTILYPPNPKSCTLNPTFSVDNFLKILTKNKSLWINAQFS